jgi:predicted glycosyltransferase/glycosyltransferase involved in cell wall biosynthesis
MPAEGPIVGFILKGYPRLSETFIAQEIQLLEARGMPIEIFSMRAPREKLRHPVHDLIKAKVLYIPEEKFLRPSIVFQNILAAWNFPRTYLMSLLHAASASLRRGHLSPFKRLLQAGWLVQKRGLGRPDCNVVHLHSHFLHVPTEMTFYLHKITGLPFSISAHAKDIYTSTKEEILERVQAAKLLMTCTHFNAVSLRRIVGERHESKIHEVYHGVSLERFQRLPEVKETDLPKLRLLTVARLVEKKGFDDVFQALALLKRKGIVLPYHIYGDGELRESLGALAKELEIEVEFHGAVAQPVVIESYRAGGVFVLGSREVADGDRDGIPNSMAEAMSMELPVVATNVSGIPELVTDGVTGLLVPQRSPEQLAMALQRMVTEPGLARSLGQAARKRVKEVFDADRCIDRCWDLLSPLFLRKKKVLFYCQHLQGIGHVTRSLSVIEELAKFAEVTYVQGGPPVPPKPKDGVRMIQLSPLLMREDDQSLFDPYGKQSVEAIWAIRKEQLSGIAKVSYDAVVIELYPFGRKRFAKEIDNWIEELKSSNPGIKVVASVRDILVEKSDAAERNRKIAKLVNRTYDQVWVHSDQRLVPFKQTFPEEELIAERVRYTGFVAEPPKSKNVNREKRILLSLGGGSVGGNDLYRALARVVPSFPDFRFDFVFGPYTEEELQKELRDTLTAFAGRVGFHSLLPNFEDELRRSALSVSMAGYNTVMNLLNTRTPALVFTYDKNIEQRTRAELLENRGYLKVLNEHELSSEILVNAMKAQMERPYPEELPNLHGARASRELLAGLIG